MTTLLQRTQAILRGDLPPALKTIGGIQAISIEPGRAVFDFEASDRHHNPMGTLHGGILCDVADAAMAWHMPPGSGRANRSPRWS